MLYQSQLLTDVCNKALLLHLSRNTGKAYVYWVEKYVRFHRGDQWRHPADMGKSEVEAFLTYLAINGASASTQNQALAALQFLYNRVLHQPLGNVRSLRAKRDRRQPEALTAAEVQAILSQLCGDRLLVCLLLYGSGLRLMEALRLRVKDLNFDTHIITACNTKSHRDRVAPVAEQAADLLCGHLVQVREVWRGDLDAGYAGASFSPALERKYSIAPREWPWQFVFPASRLTYWEDGTLRRHHLHNSAVQKAVKRAGEKAGIARRVYPHILRHSFVTHLLRAGYDIVTVQELVGHSDIRTTRRYATPMKVQDVESPLDGLKMAF